MTRSDAIVVPELYVGYPGVAFGGYVAGALAQRLDVRTARVDFRGPAPVGVALPVAETVEGGVRLGEAERPLAAAHPAELSLDVPAAPSWEEAADASERFRSDPPSGVVDCFGCGLRAPDRGLRVHCAPVPEPGLVAAAWVPSPVFADRDGRLPAGLVWGVLDCPGNWAGRFLGTQRPGAVTASLTGSVLRPVVTGEPHVVFAWLLAESGRKHTMGVALITAEGELCAVSEALWIDPRPVPM
ncbi:hypothetical protein [Streptomyces sp. NPDC057438]|uniref:hypothetical protein n=1 Tax=Streptomyces sp. NPDC057438 TaxID=3346133 RepID=UPI0036BEA62D